MPIRCASAGNSRVTSQITGSERSLVDRTYQYCDETFRSLPTCLKLAFHKFHYCCAHLSIWYQKRVTRHYAGSKARNLYHHICAARAASGRPGGHGQPKQILRNLAQTVRLSTRLVATNLVVRRREHVPTNVFVLRTRCLADNLGTRPIGLIPEEIIENGFKIRWRLDNLP